MSTPSQPAWHAPLEVGQILNRVLQLVRANLKVMVGMAAVPPLIMYGLLGLVAAAVFIPMFARLHAPPTPQLVVKLLLVAAPLVILIFVLYWLVFAIYLAAASYAAVQADYGVPVTFGGVYEVAWKRAGRYFLLLLIIYAVCFLPAIFIQLGMVASIGLPALCGAQPNPLSFVLFPFAGFLQMALLVAGCFIGLRFSLAFPASITEDLRAIEALKRSNFLTSGARLKIFLVLLVIYAATYLAMLILMSGVAFLAAIGLLVFSGTHFDFASPGMMALAVVTFAGFTLLMVVFMACSWAGFTTALCVIYNDQRRCLDRVEPAGATA